MQEDHPKKPFKPNNNHKFKKKHKSKKTTTTKKEGGKLHYKHCDMGMMKKVVGSCILNRGQSIMEAKRRKRSLQKRNEIWVLTQVTKHDYSHGNAR